MSRILTREDILAVKDMQVELVENIPGWDGSIYVRTMTGAERDAFEASLRRKDNTFNLSDVRAKMAVRVICDENGKLIFTEADIPALTRKSSRALDHIFKTAQRLSGLTDADVKELSEDLKNDPSASSTSG